jgi:thiosulfate reductase cytochrome b subunit
LNGDDVAETAAIATTGGTTPPVSKHVGAVFPLWLRISHWLNALGVILMVMSGWRVYNASPLFSFSFPNSITLGGWLGGALQWHFAAMWIIFLNGCFYLLSNVVSRRLFTKFLPVSPRAFVADLVAAFRGKLSHDDLKTYNAVQRAAYLFIILDLVILVLSGLVLWKSVQLPLLRDLLGGYETARRIHFFAMSGLVAFLGVHVVMTAFVPRTLVAMIRGR